MSFAVVPVGTVVGGRRDPANTDNWGAVTSTIVIDERFGTTLSCTCRSFPTSRWCSCSTGRWSGWTIEGSCDHEGGRTCRRIGVFAHRGPRRPNRIGVTMCEVIAR